MSREWLTLVDKEKFSPSLPFFSIKLHPLVVTASTALSIIRSYRYSSIRLCSFFARQGCCCCSRFISFLLAPSANPPSSLQPILNGLRRLDNPGEPHPVNACSITGHNSGPFYLHARPKCADLRAGLAKGPGRPAKGASQEGRHPSKVPARAGVLAEGVKSPSCSRHVGNQCRPGSEA